MYVTKLSLIWIRIDAYLKKTFVDDIIRIVLFIRTHTNDLKDFQFWYRYKSQI